jgi:hypothetical protein
MNSERLRRLVDELLQIEKSQQIQKKLSNLNTAISQLASNPGDSNFQVAVNDHLEALDAVLVPLSENRDSVKSEHLASIGAEFYFGTQMLEMIRSAMSESVLTPAVGHQAVDKMVNERQAYIDNLESLSTGLKAINVKPDDLEPGTAEIGFQIPRNLFDNEFEKLITELKEVRRIIRAFSELTTGSVEPIEVRQISTSDPLFFFGIPAATIVSIGAAITWALNTWKQVEEIRSHRAKLRESAQYSEQEISAFFDKKIESAVDQAVEEKLNELIAPDNKAGRAKEQRNDLKQVLESILARVERGMAIEVRFLPPVQNEEAVDGADGEGTQTQQAKDFEAMKELAPRLKFPPPDPAPILGLPKAEGGKDNHDGDAN